MIVSEPRAEIVAWMEARMGCKFAPGYSVIASRNGAGEIESALLFHSKTENDIEISVAAVRLPRRLLVAGFRYVVGQLGCRRATFRTRADNLAALMAMARLGAREEGRLRKYYPGDVDAVVFGILREDYPYGLDPVTS